MSVQDGNGSMAGVGAERRPFGQLVASVVGGFGILARKHVELAKIEAAEAVSVRGKGAGMMAGAAVIAMYAVGFLAAAGAAALALGAAGMGGHPDRGRADARGRVGARDARTSHDQVGSRSRASGPRRP